MSKNLLINTNDMSIFEPRRYYQEVEGTFITATDKSEDDTLDTSRYIEVTEIWGNTVQDENNLEDIQSVGELYVDDEGNPILDDLGREQYKIEIESCNKNLFNTEKILLYDNINGNRFDVIDNNTIKITKGNTYCRLKAEIKGKPNTTYILTYTQNDSSSGYFAGIGLGGATSNIGVTTGNNGIFNLWFSSSNFNYRGEVIFNKIIIKEQGSSSVFIPSEHNKTTILLPCQLQKVGNVYDRLYWDSEKGKYVVEKNTLFHVLDESKPWNKSSQNDESIFRTFACVNYFENIRGDNSHAFVDNYLSLDVRKNNSSYGNWLSPIEEGITIHWNHIGLALKSINDVNTFKEYIKNNKIRLIIPLETPELIETNITKKILLPCYEGKTYIFANSTIDTTMKVLVPYKEII